MKFAILLAALVLVPSAAFSQEIVKVNANRVCAAVVDIPYASDNFSDDEWQEFQRCMFFMKKYRVK